MDTPGYDSKGERVSQQTMERLLERLIAAKTVTLKVRGKHFGLMHIVDIFPSPSYQVGAQVMLIKVSVMIAALCQ